MNLGIPVMEEYMDFRLQQQAAMENARKIIKKVFNEWDSKFGRQYDVIERFKMDDAVIALVSIGAMTSTAKAATRNYGSGTYEIFFRLNFVAVKNVANMSNGSIAQNGNSGIIGSYSP